MSLTAQQDAIAHAELSGILKVVAYAGTGKTFSLVELSKKQSICGNHGLYLAYNKSSESDARKRFPASITCRTVHSLAYRAIGHTYKHKLRGLKAFDVITYMNLDWDWGFAKYVLDTITAWSVSDAIDFPSTAINLNGPLQGTTLRHIQAAAVAHQLWNLMIDAGSDVPMTHDAYLKLYQLSRPQISTGFIMLDEGQDTNPVTWDIVRRQTCPITIVGDRYQSIYQFRGAINAMDHAQAETVLPLTQSFRFGPKLARVANALLWGVFSEPMELQGCGPETHVGEFDRDLSHAVIARTNATVFDEAVRAMREGRTLGFAGGVHSYGFESFVDCWHLANNESHRVRDVFLKGFSDFEQLCEYGENSGDIEVKRMVEVVKNYGASIEKIVPAIHSASMPSLAGADRVLSTAHRCKGLTLDRVRLANDFPELTGDDGRILPESILNRQEVNLVYVAATRAAQALHPNYSLLQFLAHQGISATELESRNTIAMACTSNFESTKVGHKTVVAPVSKAMSMFSAAKATRRANPPKTEPQSDLFS